MGYILAKTVNGKSVNLLQDYFCKHEAYLRKSGKDPQVYFYRTKGFCKRYEKIEAV